MIANVLFTRGLPDENTVHGVMINDHLEYFILGCANVRHALCDQFRTAELLFVGRGPFVPVKYSQPPHLIFNEISDPDTHGLSLARAEAFCEYFGQVPTINHPKSVRRTTRDELSKRLDGIGGVVAPKTERCQLTDPSEIAILAEQLGLKYPLLVRVAGTHGGQTLVKLESQDHVAPVHALPLDGRDFYLTEFHDFRSSDGLYRKYRLVVVDGKPFIRHMIANDDWLIHAADVSFAENKPEIQNEEKELITSFEQSLSPRIEQAVRSIQECTEMDYFGIDCGISNDGELVLFEVNANMNVLVNSRPTPNVSEVAIDRIVNALRQLVLSKVPS